MVDTLTTNHEFTKPEIGGSTDSWGNKLNANWDKVDGLLKDQLGEFSLRNATHVTKLTVAADGNFNISVDGTNFVALTPTGELQLKLGVHTLGLRVVASGSLELYLDTVRVGVLSLAGKLQVKDDVEAFAGV